MKIALFGATGTIGQRILAEALEREHLVTAISRDPDKITTSHPGLKTVAADMLDAASVAAAALGHDAVISAYGPPFENPQTLVAATEALIAGLTTAGVARLVMVGGAGSLEAAPGVALMDTPQFPEFLRPIASAHRDALAVLKEQGSELEWTSISPPALIEPGERTGAYRTGDDQLLSDAQGQSRISAEDFAIAVLDEVEHGQFVRRRFTVAH